MNTEKISKFTDELVAYLKLNPVSISFEDLGEEQCKLILEPVTKLIINKNLGNDYVETVKCITYQLRRVFQINHVATTNDAMARLWKKDLENPTSLTYETFNDESIDPEDAVDGLQGVELDANAFSQYYLKKHNIEFEHENEVVQALIDMYIDLYESRLL